jgi:hypothetical protein
MASEACAPSTTLISETVSLTRRGINRVIERMDGGIVPMVRVSVLCSHWPRADYFGQATNNTVAASRSATEALRRPTRLDNQPTPAPAEEVKKSVKGKLYCLSRLWQDLCGAPADFSTDHKLSRNKYRQKARVCLTLPKKINLDCESPMKASKKTRRESSVQVPHCNHCVPGTV